MIPITSGPLSPVSCFLTLPGCRHLSYCYVSGSTRRRHACPRRRLIRPLQTLLQVLDPRPQRLIFSLHGLQLRPLPRRLLIPRLRNRRIRARTPGHRGMRGRRRRRLHSRRRHRAPMRIRVGTALRQMRRAGDGYRAAAEPRCGRRVLPAHVWTGHFHARAGAGLDGLIAWGGDAGDTRVGCVGEAFADGAGGAGGEIGGGAVPARRRGDDGRGAGCGRAVGVRRGEEVV